MNKPVRWGILGCARIAVNRVIPGMQMVPQAALTAVAVHFTLYYTGQHYFPYYIDVSVKNPGISAALAIVAAAADYLIFLDGDPFDPAARVQRVLIAVHPAGDGQGEFLLRDLTVDTDDEGMFWESVNAIGVLHAPAIITIYDDGYGISVPNQFQMVKENIGAILSGFQREPCPAEACEATRASCMNSTTCMALWNFLSIVFLLGR